jgi:hypothetical protein
LGAAASVRSWSLSLAGAALVAGESAARDGELPRASQPCRSTCQVVDATSGDFGPASKSVGVFGDGLAGRRPGQSVRCRRQVSWWFPVVPSRG